ncbi:MAG: aminotransferase class I/II-fold pyridoxal phosphate-dependent enzyme [bacterium]|nr:aminotransferase class I/II-fold pyridoxal phosphate-dependent enzyme [bacterium]
MKYRYTITIQTENHPGVLYRIADLFLRRKLNIETMLVSGSEKKGISDFTIRLELEESIMVVLSKQLARIVEVINVAYKADDGVKRTHGPSDTAAAIEISAIKKIQLLATSKKGVISLAQGIPSFQTPEYIGQAAKEAIDNHTADKYTQGFGIEPLRREIVKKVERDNGIQAEVDNVIVTHGGIEALMAVFLGLLNIDDEIIILSPDYASHITQTRIARHGGRPVFVALKETTEGWILDPGKIEQAITSNTKAILISNPCNPTGKVYTKKELKDIAKLALNYNLFIITDEMYEYFIYNGHPHVSIGSFPEVKDRVISIFGLSKSYAMTGWRIGYMIAPKDLAHHIFKIHDSLVTCPTAVSQYAALAALQGSKKCIDHFRNEFKRRRQIVVDALKHTDKMNLVLPEGAYYAFLKLNKEVDDNQLALDLIEEAKVAVVPGSAFGLGGAHHVRISFGCEEDVLKEGMRRLVAYVNEKL